MTKATQPTTYFHTLADDGALKWQGYFLFMRGSTAEVQLLSWLTGLETEVRRVSMDDHRWRLYSDHNAFMDAADTYMAAQRLSRA